MAWIASDTGPGTLQTVALSGQRSLFRGSTRHSRVIFLQNMRNAHDWFRDWTASIPWNGFRKAFRGWETAKIYRWRCLRLTVSLWNDNWRWYYKEKRTNYALGWQSLHPDGIRNKNTSHWAGAAGVKSAKKRLTYKRQIMLAFRHKKTDPISKAGFWLHLHSALKKLLYVIIHGKIHLILSRGGVHYGYHNIWHPQIHQTP